MRWSFDTVVKRTAASSAVNPKTLTRVITREDVGKLIWLFYLVEPMLGKTANWVEIVQVRFEQHEEATDWTVVVRFVMSARTLGFKFDAASYIKERDLDLSQCAALAGSIKEAFQLQQYRALGAFRMIQDANAEISVSYSVGT
jgi:hypothetical protein